MNEDQVKQLIKEEITSHKHTGLDARRLSGRNLENAPQPTMTTANSGGLSSGAVEGLTNDDNTIISNMRTRINEIETKLIALGLFS